MRRVLSFDDPTVKVICSRLTAVQLTRGESSWQQCVYSKINLFQVTVEMLSVRSWQVTVFADSLVYFVSSLCPFPSADKGRPFSIHRQRRKAFLGDLILSSSTEMFVFWCLLLCTDDEGRIFHEKFFNGDFLLSPSTLTWLSPMIFQKGGGGKTYCYANLFYCANFVLFWA